MGLRIRTNISALNAQRRLSTSTSDLQDSYAKVASGRRINKSADDAAGLSISENLRGQIRSLTQAQRNANDGVSLVQTAEGGLEETSNMLIRLRELATQAASDTIGEKERGFVDKEFVALKDEIDRITASTEFNGTRLLVGEAKLPDEYANSANQFPMEIQVGSRYFEKSDAIGEKNPVNIIKIDLRDINGFTEGKGSLDIGRSENGTRVHTKRDAQMSLSKLDTAITRVNEHRSTLGSIQNRLGSTSRNLSSQIENISESRSRIIDTDYATETATLAQNGILQQAGIAVQAQANQQPQVALSLLG